jgi:hypothetical protein
MIALNTTVICPEYNNLTFLNKDIINTFNIKVIKDVKELKQLIGRHKANYDINKFTEIKECVNIINNTFIKIKEKENIKLPIINEIIKPKTIKVNNINKVKYTKSNKYIKWRKLWIK